MHIRCPHCHNAIELVDETPFAEISCPSCGSNFNLISDGTTASYRERGRTLGHFELIEHVGVGHFGSVWKSRDTELDRTVALKIPRQEVIDDERRELFLREARAAAQLQHPGIVSVHEVGREDSTIYIVSDFVEGANLKEWLEVHRPTPHQAAELCIRVAEALHHAHEAGVVHRDLKPSNVMMDGAGNPLIMDFGLARREDGEITMTVEGQILGTPAYMSPEQARGEAHTADRRTDVYSLGVMLFEMLTGELPFRGEKRMLIVQILNDEPPSPRRMNSHVPHDLETICLKCIAKEPNARFSSARELAADLSRFLNGESITARPVGRLSRLWRWTRRYPARAGLGLASALSLIAVVAASVAVAYQNRLKIANSKLEVANSNLSKINSRLNSANSSLAESVSREKASRLVAEKATTAEANAKNSLDRALYFRRVNLAIRNWRQNEVGRARRLLAECPAEHRHWEWHFAYRLCYPPHLNAQMRRSARSAVFSPNGKQIVSCADGGRITLWDANTARQIRTVGNANGHVYAAEFLPEGDRVVTGDTGGDVVLWNTSTSSVVRKFKGHTHAVYDVAITADGKRLASTGEDGSVRVWDVATGKQLHILKIGGRGLSVSFAPESNLLASGGAKIQLWDVKTGREIAQLGESSQNTANSAQVRFSPDGKFLASFRSGRVMKIWNVKTKRSVGFYSPQLRLADVAFSPDGRFLATAGFDHTVMVWRVATGALVASFKGHLSFVWSVNFSPDGKRIVSTDNNGSIKIWRPIDLRANLDFDDQTSHALNCVISSDGKSIVFAKQSLRTTLKLANAKTGQVIRTFGKAPSIVLGLALSSDATRLATADGSRIILWDTKTGRELWSLGQVKGASGLAFDSDGKRIVVTVGREASVRDTGTGRELIRLEGHQDDIMSASFSRDGRRLVTVSRDRSARIWDASTGAELRSFQSRSTGPRITNIRINGKPVKTPGRPAQKPHANGHRGLIQCAAFAANGEQLVTGGDDATAIVWDIKSGNPIHRLTGHRSGVSCIAISPDGRRIATGSHQWLHIWDSETGLEAMMFTAHGSTISNIVWIDQEKLASRALFRATWETWDSGQWHRAKEE